MVRENFSYVAPLLEPVTPGKREYRSPTETRPLWSFPEVVALICLMSATAFFLDTKLKQHVSGKEAYTDHFFIAPEEFYWYAYPHRESLLMSTMMVVICTVVIINILLFERINASSTCRWICVYLLCTTAATMMADLTKCLVRRPRPDFFNRCMPKRYGQSYGSQGVPYYPNTANFTCEETTIGLGDGMASFPSGHSTYVAAAALFLYRYFRTKLRNPVLRLISTLGCVSASIYVGTGRVRDNRHHITDVVAGLTLGAVISHYVWKQFVTSM